MKRKALVAGIALLGSVTAACGGSAEEPPKPSAQTGQEMPTEQAGPPRNGPAKATSIADACSIVPEDQWRALGADQAPRARESHGNPGCTYQKGEAGLPGWSSFVSVVGDSTYESELEMRDAPTSTGEIDGYPTATFGSSDGCMVLANVSDQGYLMSTVVPTGMETPEAELCKTAEGFTEAALQNLPNA